MESLVIVILLGVVAYCLLKHTTERGTNTVRAYLYLRAINCGASIEEANRIAQADIANGPTEDIRAAKELVRCVYGGRQLPMIAEAKRLGLLLTQVGGALSRVQTEVNAPHSGGHGYTEFSAYNAEFVSEMKRLSGKSEADLHWIELTDDVGTRRAFNDGLDPIALALMIHNHPNSQS